MTDKFAQKVLTASVDRYVLTPTQCKMLRQDADVIGMKRATVLKKDGKIKKSIARSCSSCWIAFAPQYKWLYSIMNELTDAVNAEHYRFDITGVQQLQILKYNPLQQFWWHYDTYTSAFHYTIDLLIHFLAACINALLITYPITVSLSSLRRRMPILNNSAPVFSS